MGYKIVCYVRHTMGPAEVEKYLPCKYLLIMGNLSASDLIPLMRAIRLQILHSIPEINKDQQVRLVLISWDTLDVDHVYVPLTCSYQRQL